MDIFLNMSNPLPDIGVSGGDLILDKGLHTAVLISLFSDARADESDELPAGGSDRRGFWPDDSNDRFGSKLWLLQREKVLPETARRAQQYAEASLQWLIDEGIASAVAVTAELVRPYGMRLSVVVQRGTNRRYDYLWQAINPTGAPNSVNATYSEDFMLNFTSASF